LENKDIVVNSPIDINLEVNTTSPKIKDLVVESPTDIYLEVNTTSPKRLVYTKKTE
jgi:hypothetical protein